jgi:transcriptional regulator with GAF, ATPase, and Fis domain
MPTSRQKTSLDNRLLAINELYRQRKPDIAAERIKELESENYNPQGFDLGLFNYLQAYQYFYSGNYLESIKLSFKANKELASSLFHEVVGRVQLLLYRNYSELGDYKLSQRYAYDALAFFRRGNDKSGMVDSLNGLARIAFIQGKYQNAIDFLNEAVDLSRGNNIQILELVGNLGRVEILSGDWEQAEEHLKTALKLAADLNQDVSLARNHLSRGYLNLRMRQYTVAAREFRSASQIIEEKELFREKLLLMEYEGELAQEMGDIVQAKQILTEARDICRESVPESSLAAQITRRLAQAELALDNSEEALKLAQKSLDIATAIGEKNEIGLSQVIIAELFAERRNIETAMEYIGDGVETLRITGDPFDVARSLMVMAEIYTKAEAGHTKIDKCYEEAYRIFNGLKIFYYAGEARFRHGIYCCHNSRISIGFKKLIESEQLFEKISEKSKIRAVRIFKQELSRQAVALAVSNENEFKIFGDYFSDTEYSGLKSGQFDNILGILANRTGANRILIYQKNKSSTLGSVSLTVHQNKKFIRQFEELLGEEIAVDKPTLILDSRRDPFINELVASSNGDVISSVIVVPLIQSKETNGYIYLDRVSSGDRFLPFGQKELNFTVGFADLISLKLAEFEKQVLEEDNQRLKAQLLEEAAFPNIITQNKSMLEMLSRVRQVVDSNISISITGETGSGKDLLAKAIHYNSNRRDKRFISVNCAALPEPLLESELFGHKRGAFTGADRDKVGLFEEADGGTFFLDEVADMPLSIQAKVLRILEEKEIVRLGETKPIKVDVRIVSATNKELKTEMEGGRFRQDLYYRLTALCFQIPPLRDRKEDIPLLIKHFAGDNSVRFSHEAMKLLINFNWPGNVRELENEIKKLTLLAGEKGIVEKELISGKIHEYGAGDSSEDLNISTNVNFDDKFSLYDYLAEYEKRFIIKALREQGGVKKHAARYLNIPESTLRLKIKQYSIDLNDLSAA